MYAAVPSTVPASVRVAIAIGHELGQAEVEQLDALEGHEDVGRLQVTMQDAARVRLFQRSDDLKCKLLSVLDADRPA